MSIYVQKIEQRSDVTWFFIYLRYHLKLNFNPDDKFEDYVNYETKDPSFTLEECAAYEKVMDDCHLWCQNHDQDIYRIALEIDQFLEFLEGHKKISDKREMEKFANEFIDENYGVDEMVALHTYGGCNWIEEYTYDGVTMFLCIIENTSPFSDTLRDVEIVLFDWMEKLVPHVRQEKQPYPSAITRKTDIIGFFAYLHQDRSVAYHPDDSFGGYINGESREPTFTKKECRLFDKLMWDAHKWCQTHKEDIYELGMDINAYFDGHVRLIDRKKINDHYRDFINPTRRKSADLVALHVYPGGYWIEEIKCYGEQYYQTAFDGVDSVNMNLRELEVDLFNNRKLLVLRKQSRGMCRFIRAILRLRER